MIGLPRPVTLTSKWLPLIGGKHCLTLELTAARGLETNRSDNDDATRLIRAAAFLRGLKTRPGVDIWDHNDLQPLWAK